MTVRNADAADADRLAALSLELGYPVEVEAIRRRLRRLLKNEEHLILVAESPTDGIVGWIHAARQDVLEAGRFCEILGLVVASGQRGQGVGRHLVEQVEKWANERDLPHMSVRSNVARPDSHPFYERIGYARLKTQHVYRKRLAPEK
jgi:GNAT superfamily N-acetyltransferase